MIMLFRYVLDGLDEAGLLAFDQHTQIANTAVTTYAFDGPAPRLVVFNDKTRTSRSRPPRTRCGRSGGTSMRRLEELLAAHPLPDRSGGKDESGTVVVIGGPPTCPGAVLLAGSAALRTGCGRVQLVVDPTGSRRPWPWPSPRPW